MTAAAVTAAASDAPAPSGWDLFCRVVDNFGDAAVMWRLARQLALEHGCRVRLHIDQPGVLQRLVPAATVGSKVDGVLVLQLSDNAETSRSGEPDRCLVDVVVTGFHAALPKAYRRRMVPHRPVWINLEYLSAQDWIEQAHRLPSPRPDGLTERYFYPGFTATSGGLLRETDLIGRRNAFHADPANGRRFLAELGVQRRGEESIASLLCYPDAPLMALGRLLADSATGLNLIVPESAADGATDEQALDRASRGRLRLTRVPFMPQQVYDQLLWSCDFNFVRGEDSLVRAVWSGKPFVWQIYPQPDGAHLPKLEAFLRLLAGMPLTGAMRWWNGAPGGVGPAMVDLVQDPERAVGCLQPLDRLTAAPDLTRRLHQFVSSLGSPGPAAPEK